MKKTKDCMGIGDAARYLSISQARLRRLVDAGRIHAKRNDIGFRRFKKEDLAAFKGLLQKRTPSLRRPSLRPPEATPPPSSLYENFLHFLWMVSAVLCADFFIRFITCWM